MWLVLLVMAITATCFAQPDSLWMYSYGERLVWEQCHAAITTSDGGYMLCGETGQPHGERVQNDGYIVKVTEDGELEWDNSFGHGSFDRFRGLIQTSDGGFLMVGNYGINIEAWVVKTDEEGDEEWSQTFGEAQRINAFYDAVETEDAEFLLAGFTNSYGEQEGMNCLLVKLDENGEEVWLRTYGTDGSDKCHSLVQTNDGGYALGGTSSGDVYLVKLDADCEKEWSQTYDAGVSASGYSLVQMHDGGYALAGFLSYFDDGFITQDVYVVRTDSTGEEIWACDYARIQNERCFSIIEVNDGHLVFASTSKWHGRRFGVTRVDTDGEVIWDTYYGLYPNSSACYSLMPTDDNSYALAGYHHTGAGLHDFALLKTGPDPVSVPRLLDPTFPGEFILSSPYPNPFNAVATIPYQLATDADVIIGVYDATGREVTTLLNKPHEAGYHRIVWDATNQPTGTYLCRIETAGFVKTTMLTLIK